MEMDRSASLQDIVANGTVLVTVISYKNLTSFLPRFYFAKNRYGGKLAQIPYCKGKSKASLYNLIIPKTVTVFDRDFVSDLDIDCYLLFGEISDF